MNDNLVSPRRDSCILHPRVKINSLEYLIDNLIVSVPLSLHRFYNKNYPPSIRKILLFSIIGSIFASIIIRVPLLKRQKGHAWLSLDVQSILDCPARLSARLTTAVLVLLICARFQKRGQRQGESSNLNSNTKQRRAMPPS